MGSRLPAQASPSSEGISSRTERSLRYNRQVCGRFSLTTPADLVAEAFELAETPSLLPRYNIAPTQPVAVVRGGPERKLAMLRWGFQPSRSAPLINARAETAWIRPAFRDAFKKRRCLIPADAFYEWAPSSGKRQPYLIRLSGGHVFALGGLFEDEACTILTTEPTAALKPIHDRMPLILSPQDYERWLDPGLLDPLELKPLLRPFTLEPFTLRPLGPAVNNPKNEGPDLWEPRELV
jgi:putative SOS response-associated peptidase YedK